MTHNELQKEVERQLQKNEYYEYAKRYDEQHDSKYAELIEFYTKKRIAKESEDTTVTTITNGSRNVYGDYNDNAVLIEKVFVHLNSMKRSMSLANQSHDNQTKLQHENTMFREMLNLELSLRTMKTNIKRQNEK